jgi:hypothetical protein
VPDLAQAGRVAQCHWSVSRNRPDGFDFFFLISGLVQSFAKFKILCRIHLKSENYETNFM